MNTSSTYCLRTILLIAIIGIPKAADGQNLSWTKHKPSHGYDEITGFFTLNSDANHFFGVSRDHFLRSSDGITWTAFTTEFADMDFRSVDRTRDVIYARGHYFAVADKGFIARSPDGDDWTRLDVPPIVRFSDMLSLAYGNNLFVAGSEKGHILTSGNGIDWTLRYGDTTETMNEPVADLVFAKGRFVGVGERTIVTSLDGIHWTASSSSGGPVRIAYGNGQFVVLGRNGSIFTSPNAVEWTARLPALPGANYSDLAFDGHEFVAVGRDGRIATSYDGISWKTRVTVDGRWFLDVAGLNGTTVTTPPFLTSSRGAYWELTPVTGSITSITSSTFEFGSNQFVTTDGRQVNRSTNGSSWTGTVVPELGFGFSHVEYAQGVFLGLRSNQPPLFSTAGVNWLEPEPTPWVSGNFEVESIASNDMSMVYASTGSTEIRQSTDARNWVRVTGALPTPPVSRVHYGNGEFLVPLPNSMLASSSDGLEWVTETLEDFPELHDAAYGNGKWVGLWNYSSFGTYSVTSTDRINWTKHFTGRTAYSGWGDIVFVDGLFVSGSPGISTSIDGETWTKEAPDDTSVRRIIAADDEPFATTGQQVARRVRTPKIVGLLIRKGILGSPFSYQIVAHNAPTMFGANGLPDGLSVDTSSGLISGVVGESGEFLVSLETSNSFGTDTTTLDLTVEELAPVLVDVTEVRGLQGYEFRFAIEADNSPITFEASNLPPGLSISPAGVISGTSSAVGTYSVAISAINQHGSDSRDVEFVIDSSAPLFVGDPTVVGTRHAALDFQPEIHNGPATFEAIGLPDGLNIDASSGQIAGTPTVRGDFESTITATNEYGSSELLLQIELRPTLEDALDAETFLWTTGGRNQFGGPVLADWFGQTVQSADGDDAARSGDFGYSGGSWLETTVVGPAIASFDWLVSSASGSARLILITDQFWEVGRISGTSMTDWETKKVFLDEGAHTLKWEYQRINSNIVGEDAGWIDNFSVRPLNSYEIWALENRGDAVASPLDDDDLDRLSNLVEFGTGDPDALPPVDTTVDGRLSWGVPIREDPKLTVVAEFCSDLNFVNSDRSFGNWTSNGDGFAQVVFVDPGIELADRRFIRLRFDYTQ